MLAIRQVPLQGKLRALLKPLVGRVITLIDPNDGKVSCRLSPDGAYLFGDQLDDFFGRNWISGNFAILQTGETEFLVRPVPKPTKSEKSHPSQLSLFPELESEKPKDPTKKIRNRQKIEDLKALFTELAQKMAVAPDPTVKPKIKGPSEKLSEPASDKFEDILKKSRLVNVTSAGRRENVAKVPSPFKVLKSNKPLFKVTTAGLPSRKNKFPTKPASKEVERNNIIARKKTSEIPSGGKDKEPRGESSIPKTNVDAILRRISESYDEEPVKITFYEEGENGILQEVPKSGKNTSKVADLLLHRQALMLSLSPGFDRLLALSVVRDIEPLDFQLTTVRHVLTNLRGRVLLCDEVGLGKTIEAGLIMLEYILRGLVKRVLILVPPSLVEQWQQEMQSKFNLDFMVYDSSTFQTHADPWQHFPRIIASLDTAKKESHRTKVLEAGFDLVIVDEAHHLKNQRTQAYQLVNQIKKKYILLLTATPVENDLEELFTLITLLQPGQLETATSFKRKYITRGDPLKPKNTSALKQLIGEVMVRNRRSETGVITSRRIAEVVELRLSPEEMEFYQQLTGFVREYYQFDPIDPSGPLDDIKSGKKTRHRGSAKFTLKVLQREVGSSIEAVVPTLEKMAANEDLPETFRQTLRGLVEQGRAIPRRQKAEALLQLLTRLPEKVIIFTSFQQTLLYLVQRLRRQGYKVAELQGNMRRMEKEEQLQYFAAEAQVLVSTETGSEGRNLHFCSVLVNYDLPWNPMRIEQRIGRLHRFGQANDVRIYNLSAAETVESYILELLDAKINMFQLVIGELDMILGNLKEKREFDDIVLDIWAGAAGDEDLKRSMEEFGQQLASAKEQYLEVRDLDAKLLGELKPETKE